MSRTPLALVLLGAFTLMGCSPETPRAVNRTQGDTVPTSTPGDSPVIQWMFDADDEETDRVEALLAVALSDEPGGTVGELYRFSGLGDPPRYLLVSLANRGPAPPEVVLLAMGDSIRPSSTAQYQTGIHESIEGNVSIAQVRDLDGDSRMDVVFCEWWAGGGSTRAVGFNGRWYVIDVDPHPECQDPRE